MIPLGISFHEQNHTVNIRFSGPFFNKYQPFFSKKQADGNKKHIAMCRAPKTEPEKNTFFPGKKENPAKISGGPDD